MEKDTTQIKLYELFLSFFLPEGILDYFELVWAETQSLDSKESKKDIGSPAIIRSTPPSEDLCTAFTARCVCRVSSR